ncbi:hypothetical protein ABK040_008463 [Willaertia magna]
MGMFHSTSGKHGYNLYQVPTDFKITKEEMILLLTIEQSLRRSEEIQQEYTEADYDELKLEKITEKLQNEAIKRVFNLTQKDGELFDKCLIALRNARVIYKDDKDINQLTDYFKYDISRQGNLNIGDKINLNDIRLFEMKSDSSISNEKTLTEICKEYNTNNLPIALIGGSYS